MAGLCCCTNTESPPLQCVLKGYWTNNEKHTLVIGPVDQQGRFNGKYIIDKPYPLRGFQHGTNQNSQILELEFTVYWSSGSKTIFKGQCFVNNCGNEVLKTTWVLMSYVNNEWIPIRRGTYVFTRLVSQRKDDIVADFNVDENNWDADALSCTKMGQHSQEKFGSAGDFETDGIAWDADPISGSTISGSTTCF
ncbi:hypothetical protein Q9966_005930 [Columba livia]|nr:hypothetical protein Q9966_005930 [Columba livia]